MHNINSKTKFQYSSIKSHINSTLLKLLIFNLTEPKNQSKKTNLITIFDYS
jgi:hypothetical protein